MNVFDLKNVEPSNCIAYLINVRLNLNGKSLIDAATLVADWQKETINNCNPDDIRIQISELSQQLTNSLNTAQLITRFVYYLITLKAHKINISIPNNYHELERMLSDIG